MKKLWNGKETNNLLFWPYWFYKYEKINYMKRRNYINGLKENETCLIMDDNELNKEKIKVLTFGALDIFLSIWMKLCFNLEKAKGGKVKIPNGQIKSIDI